MKPRTFRFAEAEAHELQTSYQQCLATAIQTYLEQARFECPLLEKHGHQELGERSK